MSRTLKNLFRGCELRFEDLRSMTDKATGRVAQGRAAVSQSLELESTTEVLNGPAARTNWFTAGWGGVGFWLLVSVFLHLLIAYWWNSYGSKLTSQHSISSLTRLSQPGVWYAVRGACLRTVTLKCLTHGQGRLPPGALCRSPPKNICTSV